MIHVRAVHDVFESARVTVFTGGGRLFVDLIPVTSFHILPSFRKIVLFFVLRFSETYKEPHHS